MAFVKINLDTNNRTNNQSQKRRNRDFGTIYNLQSEFPDDKSILKEIFLSRVNKTTNCCQGKRGRLCFNLLSDYTPVPNKLAYRCSCGVKVFPLKGTPLEHSRLSLKLIVDIIYLMFCSKHGHCATEIERISGIKYETAHRVMMKISDMMGLSVSNEIFRDNSVIEIDEVYVKIRTGNGRGRKKGRDNKMTVLVLRERGGISKAFVVSAATTEVVKPIIIANVKMTNIIYTDESGIYKFLKPLGYNHTSVNHSEKKWVNPENNDCHTNTVESFNRLEKTSTHRIYNGVTKEYLQCYTNRVAFNATFMELNSLDAIRKLISAFPPLFVNGTRRKKEIPYNPPIWPIAA